MKNPTRITIDLDDEINDLIEKLKKGKKISQSELIRNVIRFYHENENLVDISVRKKIYFYMDMLSSGEHVILDVDHWLLFLNAIESSPEKEYFWEKHREVAGSHAEQLRQKVHSVEDLLERLEACNFFKITRNSEKDFTLVLSSETTKKFIKIFLEEFFSTMGLKAEIRENLAKLRVVVKP
jgi:hypothetical protein